MQTAHCYNNKNVSIINSQDITSVGVTLPSSTQTAWMLKSFPCCLVHWLTLCWCPCLLTPNLETSTSLRDMVIMYVHSLSLCHTKRVF